MMTLKIFKKRLSAYGADISRWPAADQADARALLKESGDARALRALAEKMDIALDKVSAPEMPAGFSARMADDILRRSRTAEKRTSWSLPVFWGPVGAGALAAAAAVAFLILPLIEDGPVADGGGNVVLAQAEIDSALQDISSLAAQVEEEDKEAAIVMAWLDVVPAGGAASGGQDVAPPSGDDVDQLIDELFSAGDETPSAGTTPAVVPAPEDDIWNYFMGQG